MIKEAVIQTYVDVGTEACRIGKFELAEKMFRAALGEAEIDSQIQVRIADSLVRIAHVYSERMEYKQAASYCKRALNIYKHALGANNQHVAWVLENLAWLCESQGKLGQACQFYTRAIRAIEGSTAPDTKSLAKLTMKLAWLLLKRNNRMEADKVFQKSLQYQ